MKFASLNYSPRLTLGNVPPDNSRNVAAGDLQSVVVSKMVKGGDNHAPVKFTLVSQRNADPRSNLPMLAVERAKLDTG